MGTTAEKIEYLNETKELIKQSLNDLGADIEDSNSFRSYVQKIKTLYEDWPKITEEGTFLSLNSTQKGKMKIELKGNTSQNGTPTPSSPVDINVVSGSNVINIENKNLYDSSYRRQNGTILVAHGTIIETKGVFSLTATDTDLYMWQIVTTGNSYDEGAGKLYKFNEDSYRVSLTNNQITTNLVTYYDKNKISLGYENRISSSFVINKADKSGAEYFTIRFGNNNAVAGTTYNFSIQLETNSTATTYEPHQGKELPLDLPVENLLDISKLSLFGNNTYLTSGSNKIPIKPNTTYTFSIKESAGQDGRISLYDSNDNNTSNYDQLSNPKNVRTFTTGANDSYLIIQRWYIGIQGATLETIEPQLEQGSKVNAYTPYGTTPIGLCKIGDYQDYFYKSGSKWYLKKYFNKKILNGNNTDKFKITSAGKFYIDTVNDYKPYNQGGVWINTHFQQRINIDNSMWIGNAAFLNLWYSDVNTLEELNTWLSNNNVILYYLLNTPTDIEITDTTLINQLEAIYNAMSYKEQTNISQENNNLPFILNVSALQKE